MQPRPPCRPAAACSGTPWRRSRYRLRRSCSRAGIDCWLERSGGSVVRGGAAGRSAAGSGALVLALALLAARHFATTSWPLASGDPGLLVAAGLLLLLAQAFKAYGWGRLFTPDERPKALALAAGNGGAALVGIVLPGRFDDA